MRYVEYISNTKTTIKTKADAVVATIVLVLGAALVALGALFGATI